MLERCERPLKIASVILGALLLFQLGRLAFRNNPLDQINIPPLPAISTNAAPRGSTNSTSLAKNIEPKGTNSNASVAGENKSTNTVASPVSTNMATNVAAGNTDGTNSAPPSETNHTKPLVAGKKETNAGPALPQGEKGTNPAAQSSAASKETNPAALKAGENTPAHLASLPKAPPRAMSPFPGPGGTKKIDLPPAIQARVDKITQSEILAAVVRPQPMALLGIAGNSAFLRSPSGQSGVVKEGDALGELKLLKIGTNRVLVELAGEKKELMVFSGFGGESLLPKEKEQKENSK